MFSVISQGNQRKHVTSDVMPSLQFHPRYTLSTDTELLCSSLFTKNSDVMGLQAAKPLITLAYEKSPRFKSLCANYFAKSFATLRLLVARGYSTTISHEEGKECEIRFPLDDGGMPKALGVNTGQQEMMHQLVLAMAGSDDTHGLASTILSEMGMPVVRDAERSIDLTVDSPPQACNAKRPHEDSEPCTSTSKRINLGGNGAVDVGQSSASTSSCSPSVNNSLVSMLAKATPANQQQPIPSRVWRPF